LVISSFRKGKYGIILSFYKGKYYVTNKNMKEILKTIIRDFHTSDLPGFFDRAIDFSLDSNKIITLVGARRTGKTYCFYQIMKQLSEFVPKQNMIYINFEDERLDLKASDLGLIIDSYYELYPEQRGELYFFFDEIQNVEGWEKFVRRIYDSVSKKIFITGSSSKLLSKEIASSLRGRSLSFEIFPFSFKEYLSIKNINYEDYSSTKNKAKIIKSFQDYLLNGSFPEIINFSNTDRRKTLQSYFDVMIYRDIIERYSIKNPVALKYFVKKGVANVGNKLSVNKLYNELKSQGIKISKDSIYEYVNYVQDCYLLFTVNMFSESVSIQSVNDKKLYCIDNGLANTISFKYSEDRGRLLENIVFLKLRSLTEEIFYHEEKRECDFIYQENNKMKAIQVTQKIDLSNKEREVEGLTEAMQRFDINEGIILTEENSDEMQIGNKKIITKPTWRWLLDV